MNGRAKKLWLAVVFIAIFIFSGCKTSVEKINFGVDACASCKMTIVDKHFATELVTSKGRAYKFDDVICMLRFMQTELSPETVVSPFVINHNDATGFIPAVNAVFVVGDQLHSPMNGNTAAFLTKEEAAVAIMDTQQRPLTWEELAGKLLGQ